MTDEFEEAPPGMGAPARRALAHVGYHRLDELRGATEAEIAGLHGMGPKGVRILREALSARGLAFKDAQNSS